MPTFLVQIDCIWDVYEVKEAREERCEGPETVRVYISEELEDCPCPWRASCPRVRVRGHSYATSASPVKWGSVCL